MGGNAPAPACGATPSLRRNSATQVTSRWPEPGGGGESGIGSPAPRSTLQMTGVVTSGDFSHGPQHVFWTCSYQMDKSRDMSLKKNICFLDGLK